MSNQEFRLCESNAGDYLRRRGEVREVFSVTKLGGGVSNTVLKASTDQGDLVLKQPFGNLRVEDDWPADRNRVHNEASATRIHEDVLEAHEIEHTTVPGVIDEDHQHHIITIESAPETARMWKQDLLESQVDLSIAKRLGRVLGLIHETVEGKRDIREKFQSPKPFYQLRIQPYHETTAQRHPEFSKAILDERDRIRNVSQTLVHGDYSPKNILVDYETPNDCTWILDFEVAHWGDPAFDTAFMLNHLFIKSIYRYSHHDAFTTAAQSFWHEYNQVVSGSIETETVRELGVLMLARVDGKSPVEYVTDEPIKDALRWTAQNTLSERVNSLEEFTALTDQAVASL